MCATRTKAAVADQAPAAVAQMPPPNIGQGHPEYHFVQSIMEMQKTLGEINGSITSLTKSVDGIKTKVDDLVGWKNKILGGAVVLGVVISVVVFCATKLSDYIQFKSPSVSQTVQTSQSPQAAPSPK